MKPRTWIRGTAFPVLFLALGASACSDEPGDPLLGPLASTSAGEEEAKASDPLAGTETVLLVDDDRVVRRFVSSALIRYGYTVLEARDADEAMELAGNPSGSLDLLLAEVTTSGMSGLQLADELQKDHPQLKVLILADSSEVSSVPRSVLVAKSFDREALLVRVREALGAAASTTD